MSALPVLACRPPAAPSLSDGEAVETARLFKALADPARVLLQVNVLFVCVGNSGRSVMAERLFRQAAAGRHESRSAGADPHGSGAEPAVVDVLRELGIGTSDHVPRRLHDEDLAWADVVVAACDGVLPRRRGEALRELVHPRSSGSAGRAGPPHPRRDRPARERARRLVGRSG